MNPVDTPDKSRRRFLIGSGALTGGLAIPWAGNADAAPTPSSETMERGNSARVALNVNGH